MLLVTSHYPTLEVPAALAQGALVYTVPGWGASSNSATVFGVNNMTFGIIFVDRSTLYEAMAINVNVAGVGGSLARLGLYRFERGKAGRLILDAGTVAIDSIGTKEIAITQTLTRGLYFTAIVVDGQPNLITVLRTEAVSMPVAAVNTAGANEIRQATLVSFNRGADVAGGLPDPAPDPSSTTFLETGTSIKLRTREPAW